MDHETEITKAYQSSSIEKFDHYLEGNVYTELCAVRVYSQEKHSVFKPFTTIWFIYNGKEYTRTWKKSFTKIGLARLANAFVREMLVEK